MGRKNRKPWIIENLPIEDTGAEGKSVGRTEDGRVVFVSGTVPGDVVDVKVVRKKKSFLEAKPVNFHEYSNKRIAPFCEHFELCGGCKWQYLNYNDQLHYKHKQVVETLERIGGVQLENITPIIPSAKTTFYRNKLEFTFSNKRWLTDEEIQSEKEFERRALGFHAPGRFDAVIPIEQCHLQNELSNQIRNSIRDFALEKRLSFFDIRKQNGFLRTLVIRTTSMGETMVILTFYEEHEKKRQMLLQHIADEFPQLTSLLYVINPKGNDTFHDLEVHTYKGQGYITEQMDGLKFQIGPKSFYQTNSEQALELYKVARDFAEFTGKETVYDLYTGTGTIANFVASQAKKVIGIEYVPEAIEDAKVNSNINGIKNTAFYSGDLKDVLNNEFIRSNGAPDVIITDPPRAGMHEKVVEAIAQTQVPKIIYVSCNPASQARDIALLTDYRATKVQPVDMFPHTQHVENVVLLEKK